jgi:hypothetical protein
VLKSDHIPGIAKDLEYHIKGAPNFRGIPAAPIFGTAQPTTSGIRTILNLLGAKASAGVPGRTVVWINLREEPVVYLNNRPFVLREAEFPFRNMSDFQGTPLFSAVYWHLASGHAPQS